MKKPHVNWPQLVETIVLLVTLMTVVMLLGAFIAVPGILWFGPWWTIGTTAVLGVGAIVLANTDWR
jgi:hypothetical protein